MARKPNLETLLKRQKALAEQIEREQALAALKNADSPALRMLRGDEPDPESDPKYAPAKVHLWNGKGPNNLDDQDEKHRLRGVWIKCKRRLLEFDAETRSFLQQIVATVAEDGESSTDLSAYADQIDERLERRRALIRNVVSAETEWRSFGKDPEKDPAEELAELEKAIAEASGE